MLAQLRRKVGSAGPEEVYRWESQEATDTSYLISVATEVEKARIYLNQILGEDQSKLWNPQDIELGENDYYFLGSRLKGLLSNERDFMAFEEFIVAYALRSSPTLMAIDKNTQAQKIQLGQAKRSFVLPELAVSFSYDYVLDEKLVGVSLHLPVCLRLMITNGCSRHRLLSLYLKAPAVSMRLKRRQRNSGI